VSKALLSWIVTQGIGTALIEPGKPWQNGVAESFNGKFRDECLSLEWFRSRAEAKVLIEEWRRHFNEVRPHYIWGLRAPARCSTVPAGTNAASKGSRLKLTVVRRTWAGHCHPQHPTSSSRGVHCFEGVVNQIKDDHPQLPPIAVNKG
jgi:hypothetical protein